MDENDRYDACIDGAAGRKASKEGKRSEGVDVPEQFYVKKHVPHVKAISESVQETASATHVPEHL